MGLKLSFGHNVDGNATATMKIDGSNEIPFDYVALVKWLFDNRSEPIAVDVSSSYTSDQKKRIEDLVREIEATVKGENSTTCGVLEDDEDIPF